MKIKTILFILFALLFGCRKDKIVVLNDNLTNCPANSACTYTYFDNADFKDWSKPVPGRYRVFWYKSTNKNLCDITTELYFKTSLSNDNFDITSAQIAGGKILGNNLECICCDYSILAKPIGGEIKGTRSDGTHWLINASIIFGTSATHPTDTLVVNQYFSSERLP